MFGAAALVAAGLALGLATGGCEGDACAPGMAALAYAVLAGGGVLTLPAGIVLARRAGSWRLWPWLAMAAQAVVGGGAVAVLVALP